MIVCVPTMLVEASVGSLVPEVRVFGCKLLVSSEMDLNAKLFRRGRARIWYRVGVECYDGTEFTRSLKHFGQQNRGSFAVCYLLYVSRYMWQAKW